MRQEKLPIQRDYLTNPRRSNEFDTNMRGDLGPFEESRTKQSDAEAADINYIMARYEQTGFLPELMGRDPIYGDFSDAGTYQEALSIVQIAREQFAALDARVRARFGNDPEAFLEFVNNPANGKELVELGLGTERKPQEDPMEVLKGIRENTKPVKKKPQPDSGALS